MWLLSVPRINSWLTFSCIVGLGLSLYAYTVELQLEMDEKYQPMCDLNPHVSCSKAFSSEYGKGFGIFGKGSVLHKPNSLFGLMFYSMIATLAQSNSRYTVLFSLVAIALSNILSLYFAYILYFILYDLCIVCVSIYVVNVINLILIQLKIKLLRTIEENEEEEEEKKNK
ncbi:vitamin K epoxide reductase complex subunit 1-like protein 1 [Anoplophora glabripennis]|uniref:vitamin K epoxide reductase complex subunit 1-like protein 1 n=1 Tax=Anoplophora glabripennis TaxID=217634 RepID=UPI000874F87F|nr:vitamin K epoxide reductase complex subunit 1-like protein 1 [Anoplophora glabripennis]